MFRSTHSRLYLCCKSAAPAWPAFEMWPGGCELFCGSRPLDTQTEYSESNMMLFCAICCVKVLHGKSAQEEQACSSSQLHPPPHLHHPRPRSNHRHHDVPDTFGGACTCFVVSKLARAEWGCLCGAGAGSVSSLCAAALNHLEAHTCPNRAEFHLQHHRDKSIRARPKEKIKFNL